MTHPTLRRRQALMLGLGAAAGLPLTAAAQSSDWPSKPITVVLGLPAGSATDVCARILVQGMSNELKVPVVVDNKVGASQFIAARHVARAPADGYTLFMGGNTTHSSNEFLFKQIPYDPVKDYTPISMVFEGFLVLMVNAASPARSVNDLIARAKAAPGKMSFGAGTGSTRLSAEMLRQLAGVELIHVPYKGNPQALNDLIGGQVDFVFVDAATALNLIPSGKVRALALTSAKRHERFFPGVPAMGEIFTGYEQIIWTGVYGPAGLPPAIGERLNAVIRKVVASSEMKAWGEKAVFDMVASSPTGLAESQAAESDRTRRVVRAAGIVPE